MKAVCGIYKIEHSASGMVYIGQSIDIHKRWREHAMGEGNALLARAVRAYGWDAFTATILFECSVEELDVHEITFIKSLKSQFPGGYNLLDGGQGALSPEERARREAAKIERLWQTNPKRAFAIVEQKRWAALTPEEQQIERRARLKAKEAEKAIEQEIKRIAYERRNAEIMAEVRFCQRESFVISQAESACGHYSERAEKEKTPRALQAVIDAYEFVAQQARCAAEFANNWIAERAKWTAEEGRFPPERQEWSAKASFWFTEANKLSAKAAEWKAIAAASNPVHERANDECVSDKTREFSSDLHDILPQNFGE